MLEILLAFVTGLTTGGLSCLAVQGGLLASSLAGQIEKDLQQAAPAKIKGKQRGYAARKQAAAARPKTARPILAFLLAKLLAYTLLGFLLGWLGQMFQLSPVTRAILQIAIGIFMVGTALRMLNVHPIFRYFAFEPPASLRRRLRRSAASADGESLTTPIFLGLLTVLIPCGITQAMMAAALGTGSPIMGAALMFSFTLGASPVFFAVAYFATQLGSRLEKNFTRVVAVIVLILGLITIDGGVTLAGSPVSITRLVNRAFAAEQAEAAPSNPDAGSNTAAEGNVITVQVENGGYNPNTIHAKAGEPLTLRLVSEDVYSCSLAFIIPALGEQHYLDTTDQVDISIPAQEAGTRIPFSCSMGMYTGVIIFDL